ncbi:hypothetical protein ACK321_12130 [Aeromonas hydrophila]|uniref:hypothetical protein n=1 Tax=Aeromonas hydrophila TaxID=644 RepID=UPI00398A28BE
MKLEEVHVVFNCLDGTTELSRSESLEGIQRPDQPHEVALTRLMFAGGYMLQVADELTVIQKGDFKITYLNCEPDNLVIYGDCKNQEPAGYEGDVMTLLQEYECSISCDDWIKMRTVYTRVMLTIS